MTDWLDPVRLALDEADGPATVFFRDDDAGWSDDHLYRLLDVFDYHSVPIDLAVIPAACSSALARGLTGRIAVSGGRLRLHQHGLCHANHEPTGRKCEFGTARSAAEQTADIANGKRRLEDLLGANVDPIFTPPWNRCTQATVEVLASLKYQILSRDVTATPLAMNGLQELPVCVDWCRWQKHEEGSSGMGRHIADFVRLGRPVGIMLHHAVMTRKECAEVDALLHLLAAHSGVRCRSMQKVVYAT